MGNWPHRRVAQIAKTISETEMPIERIRNAAREEGFDEGLSRGRLQGALGAAALIGLGCAAVAAGVKVAGIIAEKASENGWFDGGDFDEFDDLDLYDDDLQFRGDGFDDDIEISFNEEFDRDLFDDDDDEDLDPNDIDIELADADEEKSE